MGNEVLNIFSKKVVFLVKMGEKIFGDMTIFYEKRSFYVKNEYNLLYRKLDAKYFHVALFFR